MSYRIYFVGVLNIGEKLNKSPIAKIKSSPINLPVRYMEGDQCQKYLFLVDVQTYFVGTFFMVIFLFERHLQI